MEFQVKQDILIKPLQAVVGVVEKRQTLPILANILLRTEGDQVTLTGTDLELELQAVLPVRVKTAGTSTLPARKLFDIVRNLPADADIQIQVKGDKAVVRSGSSRFSLQTLPSNDFPAMDRKGERLSGSISQGDLKSTIDDASVAMAQQDVRYYLNGLLLEFYSNRLRCVSTDGHRLAMAEADAQCEAERLQVIMPRKAVMELQRLLDSRSDPVQFAVGDNFFRVLCPDLTFTCKLIDGRFPDYERVIPKQHAHQILVKREPLRAALNRVLILSSDKLRSARLQFGENRILLSANNVEQEQAEEEITIQFAADDHIDIGFNILYLIDVMQALDSEQVEINLRDGNSSAIFRTPGKEYPLYVIMPMRL